jgi:cytosine/adenosine deaminase-related metal-dependent hydrolase
MRFGLGFSRWDATHQVNTAGAMPEKVSVTAREALNWTTINAAEAMGLDKRVGSLTPGKRADLIMVGGAAMEQHPRTDVYGTLLFHTTVDDVRTVLVDGRVVKRNGELVDADLPRLLERADTAADDILTRIADAGQVLPGTPPGAWDVLEPMFLGFRDEARSVK